MLVGYEGDGGHVYKVWDPINKKLIILRDVGFLQPGNNDDDTNLSINEPPTDPKDPDDDDVVGFMPVSLTQGDEISKPDVEQRLVVYTLPTQTPTQMTTQIPTQMTGQTTTQANA